VPLASCVALALIPWTLWLTFTLPSRHVSHHYDIAWVGFDVALAGAFAATALAAVRASTWLPIAAAVTGTMLLCDAWFDTLTSASQDEQVFALLEALFAELPLAAVCAWIVIDVERFQRATVLRYLDSTRRRVS
jgi:hypothetical protein